jgi:hypothetical protein
MPNQSDSTARADGALAVRPGDVDDASISWSRDPSDDEEPEPRGGFGGPPARPGAGRPTAPVPMSGRAANAALAAQVEPAAQAEVVAQVEPAAQAEVIAQAGPAAPAVERLWPDAGAQELLGRWREVQLRFVDDPAAAAQDAEALVVQATEQLAAMVAARRSERDGDTEELRLTVRRYRALLYRILDL